MEKEPKVSVIMGIYNCEDTLTEALDSIINQTYTNWELVLCDDGSTDGTYELAKSYQKRYPDKVVLLRNETNMKLAYSLNRCLEVATGELIARMDGDDISHPERLQCQVDYLHEHPGIQLVGTAMRNFDENGYHGVRHPVIHPAPETLMRTTPFFHATILSYKYVYDVLKGYSTEKRAERVEDIDLWFRFFHKNFRGENLDEPLYDVREDFNTLQRRTLAARIHSVQTRWFGYGLLGFPKKRLIGFAVIQIMKGLTPSQVTMLYRKAKERS